MIYSYLLRPLEPSVPIPEKKPVPAYKPIPFQSWVESIPMAELRDRAIGSPITFEGRQIGTISDIIKNSEGKLIGIVIDRKRPVPGNSPAVIPESRLVGRDKFEWLKLKDERVTAVLTDSSALDDAPQEVP